MCIPRDEKAFDAVEKLIQKEIPRLDNPLKSGRPEDVAEDAAQDEKPKRQRRGRGKPKDEEVKAETAPEETPREDKPRKRRDRRGDGKRDEPVTGMGDHLPGFIAMSFEERRSG